MKTVCILHKKFFRGVRELTSVLLHPGWFWPCITIMQYFQMHSSMMKKWLPDVRVVFSLVFFFWDPWTNSPVWTVYFLSVCMCMYSKNNSIENIWNGNIRKNKKWSCQFIALKNQKSSYNYLSYIWYRLPLPFCQAETDTIYQNTDHFQLWERSPWKEEKIQLIIWPSPRLMIESFIKTPVVKDSQGHRMCGRIQWLAAICWLSKYIHNFFQLTVVKNYEVFFIESYYYCYCI